MSARRLLLVSPHFPPDPTAGAHRARLLGRHLPAFGWTPTILTVAQSPDDPSDPSLLSLVSSELEVVRVPAWPARVTRPAGFGDLGLRSYTALRRAGAELLAARSFDAVFITIYPVYPALLGPRWRQRFNVPFVIDYQDPWVGSWGLTVGGGPEGRPDARSRLSRRVGLTLEPRVLRSAAGVTAVSDETCQELWRRYPDLRRPHLGAPIGAEPDDFVPVREGRVDNPIFQRDERIRLCYVGTVLPKGRAIVDGVLGGLRLLRARDPALGARLSVHFVGSSNQTGRETEPVVRPMAAAHGVDDLVSEHPARVPYLDALRVLNDADVIFALGSTEAHYSPSKLYPCLLARRPLLSVYRAGSDPAAIVERLEARGPGRTLLTVGESVDHDALGHAIADRLPALVAYGRVPLDAIPSDELDRWSAKTAAAQIAAFLHRVVPVRREAAVFQ